MKLNVENKNIQVGIETVVRCGGNCSGCALSSSERMTKSLINYDLIKEKVRKAKEFIEYTTKNNDIESISIFMGQGDHFLLPDEDLISIFLMFSEIVPIGFKHKSVFFLSASAIGRHEHIVRKMDKLFELSVFNKIPFFVQVVFDPKKIELSDAFRDTYLKNIAYFKKTCGMTELTVNVGKDLYETMDPKKFSEFVSGMGITHVEFNWVFNKNTSLMWKLSYKRMFEWLKELIEINSINKKFEINFIPFLARAFLYKNVSNTDLISKIANDLSNNFYIDNLSNTSFAQSGLISNLIPLVERLFERDSESNTNPEVNAIKIFSRMVRSESCSNCDYLKVCSLIGSNQWAGFWNKSSCPFGIKDFLEFIELSLNAGLVGSTCYTTNPVQHSKLINHLNNTAEFYESNFRR